MLTFLRDLATEKERLRKEKQQQDFVASQQRQRMGTKI
jgi:hypothetical protein